MKDGTVHTGATHTKNSKVVKKPKKKVEKDKKEKKPKKKVIKKLNKTPIPNPKKDNKEFTRGY